MSVYLAAISKAHSAANFDNPCSMSHAVVKEVWSGIRRTVGVAQTAKAAATNDQLKQMLQVIPSTTTGIRDRALFEEISFVPEGAVVMIRRSKTDQESRGESVARTWQTAGDVPCPCPQHVAIHIRHHDWPHLAWHQPLESIAGPALTDKVLALQVKKYAEAAGLNPSAFAGHSLRAGLATSAAIAGVNERKIIDQTRHKSVLMVRRYVRDANLFRENVSAAVGLRTVFWMRSAQSSARKA